MLSVQVLVLILFEIGNSIEARHGHGLFIDVVDSVLNCWVNFYGSAFGNFQSYND